MAKNSMESRLIEQSDMIIQLNKTILSLQQTIENFNAKEAALLQEIQTLREQNDYLVKKLFGKSSEKNQWTVEGQIGLFNEAELEQDLSLLEPEQEEAVAATTTDTRKKRTTDKVRYTGLPVEKKFLDVPEEERFCFDCNTPLVEIGETFVRRELKFRPASLESLNITARIINVRHAPHPRKLLLLFRARMAERTCFTEWLLHLRLPGLCIRSMSMQCRYIVLKKISNKMELMSPGLLWQTGSFRIQIAF